MSPLPYLDHDALLQLASAAAHVTQPCTCTKTPLAGWTTLPLSLPDITAALPAKVFGTKDAVLPDVDELVEDMLCT